MTDTPVPDVRELAAKALYDAADPAGHGYPWDEAREWIRELNRRSADAVLAAVTPVIRQQVAEEIADSIHAHDERYGGRATRYDIGHSDALQTAADIARNYDRQPPQDPRRGCTCEYGDDGGRYALRPTAIRCPIHGATAFRSTQPEIGQDHG